MLNGRHAESLAKTYQRADAIFKSIARFPKNDEKFLLITHGFFMRVLELYIKKHGAKNIKIAPQDLLRTKRNTYFRGFATDYKLSTFLRF
jgi:broad specificity phosphatase PhoE